MVKVSVRLVHKYLKTATESHMDPFQFAYRSNRSVEGAVFPALLNTLQHLESPSTYTWLLFVGFSSAFNSIMPHKFYEKLRLPNGDIRILKWILDFLLGGYQVVKFNGLLSASVTLNSGVPQGCVLSPCCLLFCLTMSVCSDVILC